MGQRESSLHELSVEKQNALGSSFVSLLQDMNSNTIKAAVVCVKPEGVSLLSDALKVNKSLVSIEIGGKNLQERDFLALAEALKQNESLSKFRLGPLSFSGRKTSSGFNVIALNAFVDAVLSNTRLCDVEFAGEFCESGLDSAKCFRRLVASSGSSLTKLSISTYKLNCEGTIVLAEGLKSNSSLTSLSLGNNSIRSDGMQALTAALVHKTALTELDLSFNDTGPMGYSSLCEFLALNSSLKSLNLSSSRNLESTYRVVDFCNSLKQNQSLTLLKLNSTGITIKGLDVFSELLLVNRTINTLDLSLNLFCMRECSETRDTLAKFFKSNKSVTCLKMHHNELGMITTILADLLKTDKVLRRLDLFNFDFKDKEIFENALLENVMLLEFPRVGRKVDLIGQRNEKYERIRESIVVIIAVRRAKQSVLNVFPKEIVQFIAKRVWAAKTDQIFARN